MSKPDILLLHPPVAKPGEPPAGIARLAGALAAHGISHTMVDASLEGLLYLLDQNSPAQDTWTQRALKNSARNLKAVRSPATYRNNDRYQRTVRDLNRVLENNSLGKVSLANYQEQKRSPLQSKDLLQAATCFSDTPFYHYFKSRLSPLIQQKDFTHVGLSLNYLSQALSTFALIGYIRHNHPHLTIILGGGLITSWLSSPNWSSPFTGLVDHLVKGPGEKPLLNLLGKAVAQETFSPLYDNLPLDAYLSPGRVLPYAASSGCYWNKCSFCPEKAENNPYCPQPPDKAHLILSSLCKRLQPQLIHFLDNAVSPALMRRLIDQPAGPPWYGFARIETQLADLQFCLALKQSGCCMLKLGLESGNQQVLDLMHKGISLDLVTTVLHNLHQAGIMTYVYLLFGTPEESPEQARDTLEFTAKHAHTMDFLNLAIFNLPRFSPESDQYLTQDFYHGDLSLYSDFIHPLDWNRKKIRSFLDREFKRHPAITPIIQRDPPFFTSNHAPFMPI